MKTMIFASLAGALLVSAPVVAQDRSWMREGMRHDRMMDGMMGRLSPEDVDAFTDAHIAALRAGLKLSADQERLWPPVEEAIRAFVKLRRDQVRAFREQRDQGRDQGRDQARDDIPGMLRSIADRQGARAEALRRLADGATPLYAMLDEGQKRRLRLLARHMRPHGGAMREGWRRMMGRDQAQLDR